MMRHGSRFSAFERSGNGLLSRFALALVVLAAALLLCATAVCAYAADGSSGASSSNASASSSSASASSEAASSATSVDSADDNYVDPTQRADNSFIYDTTIESLFDEASLYDGRTVQVSGEAIGDLIYANDDEGHCWVMLTSTDVDNPSSISVLMSEEQARQIDHFGNYSTTGTTLQVRGVYHQACSEHDGLPDIHVTNSAVLVRGVDHPDTLDFSDYLPGIVVVVFGGILMALYYIARERAR